MVTKNSSSARIPAALGIACFIAGAVFADDALAPVRLSLPGGQSVNVVKCYPEGKMRASCQSFDDGTLGSDWPALDALRKRGIPATFFINSTHPQSKDAVKFPQRYAGFEAASHGANHKGLSGMTPEQVQSEIQTDQKILGEAFGQVIDGFAFPYGDVPKDEAGEAKLDAQLRSLGLVYARKCGATKAFAPPEDFMRWVPDCGMLDSLDRFLAQPADEQVRVRMCFTHSIDFARGNESFDKWLAILDQLVADSSIWNVTMRDYAHYVTALRALAITTGGIANDSSIPVWVKVNGHPVGIAAYSKKTWSDLKAAL